MAALRLIRSLAPRVVRRRAWVESLSRSEYASDALIVAGDVSDDSAILAATLRAFKERFAEARSA